MTLKADGRIDHHFRKWRYVRRRYSYNNANTSVPGCFPTVKVAGLSLQSSGDQYGFPGDLRLTWPIPRIVGRASAAPLKSAFLSAGSAELHRLCATASFMLKTVVRADHECPENIGRFRCL
jgi:hypothetical protein